MTGPHCILAIDPGISGALAYYFPDYPERISTEDMPIAGGDVDAVTLARRLNIMMPDICVMERVGAMPGQGVSSTFKFGRSFGTAIGVVGALKVPLVFVAPSKWKAHFRLSADKEQSRALALRMFPTISEQFERKKDHNRAEAALIARYGAETLNLVARHE
jgi:hypothetical protein